MKKLIQYIYESKNMKHPKSKEELIKIIKRRIEDKGFECNLNDIDVSEITDMSCLFMCSSFNGDISEWDVSNVENMNDMFYFSDFNGDLSKWAPNKLQHKQKIFKLCPLEKNKPNWVKRN